MQAFPYGVFQKVDDSGVQRITRGTQHAHRFVQLQIDGGDKRQGGTVHHHAGELVHLLVGPGGLCVVDPDAPLCKQKFAVVARNPETGKEVAVRELMLLWSLCV